jgi:TonB family protein
MSLLASIPSEFLKTWEGRVVDGQFPLQKWLGGSEHSAVFLTERSGKVPAKAAIKLVWAENFASFDPNSGTLNEDDQLSRWRETSKLSHPHLIRLFESGRGAIGDQRFLYVVMEYAEEDLGQILPIRPLSSEEVSGMLPPTAQALDFLHQAGFVHGRIKPSNVMAVNDQLKISADGLSRTGEHSSVKSSYDAPELASQPLSPAADIWSLGAMLVAVLTQQPPKARDREGQTISPTALETMREPFRSLAQQSLRARPEERGTVNDILGKLNPSSPDAVARERKRADESGTAEFRTAETGSGNSTSRPSMLRAGIIVTIVVAILIVGFLLFHRSSVRPAPPPQEVHSPETQTTPSIPPASQPPAARAENTPPLQGGTVAGSVREQVPAAVSRGAESTIHGRVKVTVRLQVDASGNVSQATISSEGPSRYFAGKALAAARLWKFNPAKVEGQPAPSEWILRFQFGRNSQQVFPTETKP